MAQKHEYWTHGVATILESPQLARLVLHRGDLGTVVEQDANTAGWFHIPIPTPTILADDTTTSFLDFTLVGKLNQNARVDLLHVRRGKDLIHSEIVDLFGDIMHTFNTPDVSTSTGALSGRGITLCVRVQFRSGTPRGRVEFYGAGAAFA